jgi:hypothetical protein
MGSPTGTADKMRDVGGIRVVGGSYPARIWQAYMGPAMEGLEPLAFAQPDEVEKGPYLHIEGESPQAPTTTSTTVAKPKLPGKDHRKPPED